MNGKLSSMLLALVMGMLIVAIGMSLLPGMAKWYVTALLVIALIIIPFVYKWIVSRAMLRWDDSYSIGIAAIDEEHKKWIGLINVLSTAYTHEIGDEYEQKALNELRDYTVYHFGHEEELMEKYGYEGLEAHKEIHKQMVAKVESFVEDYNKRGHEALGDIVPYMEDWLINHIKGSDKEYATVLIEKGLR